MIFKQIAEILSGQKTQTRRRMKPNEFANQWRDDVTINEVLTHTKSGEPCRLKWGLNKTYAIVPKRGKPAIRDARIRITSIRQERLQAISEADAIAEGVASVAEYRDLWERINGRTKGARWQDNPLVWVLTFEVVM